MKRLFRACVWAALVLGSSCSAAFLSCLVVPWLLTDAGASSLGWLFVVCALVFGIKFQGLLWARPSV